jgi:LacI family transcriptional regulator
MGFEPGGKSPSVNFIAETLEERIQTGEYPHGQRLPTERDLAEEFKVSRTTVRMVLVELGRKNLVVRANGCRPLVRGDLAVVRTGDTATTRRSLGLQVSGDPTDIGGALTARGLHHALDSNTFRLVVANPVGTTMPECIQSEAQLLGRMSEDADLVGVILWYLGGSTNVPTLRKLRAAKLPMVFIDRLPPPGFEADYVGVNNKRAAAEMVRHLLSCGHRRIAFITNTDPASTVAERLAGYHQALKAAGVTYRQEQVMASSYFPASAEGIDQSANAVVERLLAQPDAPTALFAVNDHAAVLLVEALQAHGIRVPQDIAVAGFDDIEWCQPGKPFLTTIRQPFERMGEEAARLMLERLEPGTKPSYRHVLLDATLVVRDSTCPKS